MNNKNKNIVQVQTVTGYKKYTNLYGVPDAAVKALTQGMDRSHSRGEVHVTELVDHFNYALLNRRHNHEAVVDVLANADILFGNAIHKAILEAKPSFANDLREENIRVSFDLGPNWGTWVVTGTPDYIVPIGKRKNSYKLVDWKTAKSWKWVFRDFIDWIEQTNFYRVILWDHGFKIDDVEVWAFVKDFMPSRFKKDPTYPNRLQQVKIPLWPIPKARKLLKERLIQFATWYDFPDHQLPGCAPRWRWVRNADWAVFKSDNKNAIKGGAGLSEREAKDKAKELGHPHRAVERKGTDTRCDNPEYCRIRKWCPYFREKMGFHTEVAEAAADAGIDTPAAARADSHRDGVY